MGSETCKILIADDHMIVVDGMVALINERPEYEVVVTVSNGLEAQKALQQQAIHIAILDIQMPGMDGIALTEWIQEHSPDTKVLMLTMSQSESVLMEAYSAGIFGFVAKEKGADQEGGIIAAMECIHKKGQKYFSPDIMEKIVSSWANWTRRKKERVEFEDQLKLTRREKEVLSLLAQGDSSRLISSKLNISITTTDTHRRNLLAKIGCENSKKLIIWANEHKTLWQEA